MAVLPKRFNMWIDDELLRRLDEWRSRQPGLPSRAEALRRLATRSLDAEASQETASAKRKRGEPNDA